MRRQVSLSGALVVAFATAVVAQAPAPSLTEADLAGFTNRPLGPYRAASWIADIAVPDAPQKSHLYTFYVGVRYGGVWKTTNNGTTFNQLRVDQRTRTRKSIVPNDDGLGFDDFLKAKAAAVKVTISDATGREVRTLEGPGAAGLSRVTWDMTAGRGRLVEPGEYTVTLLAGEKKLTQKVRVLAADGRWWRGTGTA